MILPTLFVENPGASENDPSARLGTGITIASLVAVLRGSATPSVTWSLRFGPDRSAAGTEVVTGGTTTTDTTTGDVVSVLNNPTVPANNYIWLVTTAQSGTVDSLAVSIAE